MSNDSFKSAPVYEILSKLTPDYHVHKLSDMVNVIEEKVS